MSLPGKTMKIGGYYHGSDQGNGDKVAFLVHGIPDDGGCCKYQAPALLKAGYRVIVPVARFCFLTIAAVCVLVATPVRAQFGGLTMRIPDGANTIVLVDVEKLHNTPLGKKEGWKEQHQAAFDAGVAAAPSDATKFVMAAKLDFETMDPEWQVGLMDLTYDPSIPKAALRYRGSVDRISGREVAVLPGDMYAVKFGPRVVGVGSPAKRQDVARWISRIYGNTLRGVTPYLKEAQNFAEGNAPITMAMDLSHVVSAAEIKAQLADWEPFKEANLDIDKVSKALASIRGVTLGISVRDKRTGAIKVDFDEDVSMLGDLAKPLLLRALENNGAMISEFYTWKASVSGKSIQITGTLESSGLRRILSVLDVPPPLQEVAARTTGQQDPKDEQKLVVLASQSYFKSVSSLIDDLKRDRKNRKTMGQISVWFGRYAQQIDRLPMLNVDQELLEYGKFVAESLRHGQLQVTGAAARSRVRQNDVPEQYDVRTYYQPIGVVGGDSWRGRRGGVYGWGGWTAQPNQQARGQLQARIRTQEQIRGNTSASLVLQGIDNATADIRRHMTDKHNAAF